MTDWTEGALRRQYDHAVNTGLFAVLQHEAKLDGLPVAYVLAIASRETNICNILGDSGHGHGPMQLDDRSHKIPAGWQSDAALVVGPCCELLASLLHQAESATMIGGKGLTGADAFKWAAAAYNAGPVGADRGHRAGDCDRYTTGGDYGKDVLARTAVFEKFLTS